MIRFTIEGQPITKKNSQQIVLIGGRPRIIPSKQYKKYESQSIPQLPFVDVIDYPINLKCTYFMQTRRKVDLVNLLEATCDILVKAEILADDNCKIVVSHDGSRVEYDKENPRVEIEITEVKDAE